jgi:hypothetical protein
LLRAGSHHRVDLSLTEAYVPNQNVYADVAVLQVRTGTGNRGTALKCLAAPAR